MNDWKGIRKNIFEGNTEIELYNLSTDIQEQHNVAADQPEVVQAIRTIMGDRAPTRRLRAFSDQTAGRRLIIS